MDCLLRFCIAMLLNIRTELLQGDFSHAIIHQAMQLKLAAAAQ